MRRHAANGASHERVVIIGGGASGVLAAVRFLSALRPPAEVVLIESSHGVGRGVAYSTTNPEHVLNVPAGRMSAFPENPGHFVRWLASREDRPSAHEQTYAPRASYAVYLGEVLDEAERGAAGVRLDRVNDTALGVAVDGDTVRVTLASGKTIDASRVVLALGNLPPHLPLGADLPRDLVVDDPWAAGALESIPSDGDLVIIGTGLTMIDIALALASRHNATIHAISRHGLLPHEHPTARRWWDFAADGGRPGAIPLRQLVRRVRVEVARASDAGATWHDVMDTLRPIGAALWQRLSIDDRRRFLRHVRAFWEVHRHRMAPSVAKTFDRLRAEGRVRIYAGRMIDVSASAGGGLDVAFVPRGGTDSASLHAAVLINATGPASDWRAAGSPLVRSLIDAGVARFDPLGLGLDATPDGILLDIDGKPQPGLLAIGPPLRGVLWETTAVPDIREQARRLPAAETWAEANGGHSVIPSRLTAHAPEKR